jgi:hypothetical protein
MLDLLRKTWRLLLIPLFALGFFLGAYFFFYRGGYDAPESPQVSFEKAAAPSSSFSAFAERVPTEKGMLLLDGAHRNDFTKAEITTFVSRVADRGYTIEFIGEERSSGGFRSLALQQRLFLLDEKLRQADSFAVILPDTPYEKPEVDIIERFVRKGGKLLLMADPTRDHNINSLAGRFGIGFQPDYLYNTVDYDINCPGHLRKRFPPRRDNRGTESDRPLYGGFHQVFWNGPRLHRRQHPFLHFRAARVVSSHGQVQRWARLGDLRPDLHDPPSELHRGQ